MLQNKWTRSKSDLTLVTFSVAFVLALGSFPPTIATAQAASRSRIVELKHDVNVTIINGTARFTVERRFLIGGESLEPARIPLFLPGAASLENAKLDWGKGWQPLKTLTRAAANREFRARWTKSSSKPSAVTGPTVPVIFRQESRERVVLEAAMVRPGTVLALRYDLVAPTCNGNGRNSVGYPYERRRLSAIRKKGKNGMKGDRLMPTIRGNIELADIGEKLPKEKGNLVQQACHGSHGGAGATLVASVPSPDSLRIRWASVQTENHELERLEIDLPTIADPPSEASVVFVLDGSFSMADKRLRRQLGVVRSLVHQFPNGQFQLVVYSRAARWLFPTFIDALGFERALRRVSKKSRALANGSHLELGLVAAAQQLAGRAGPQRIIAFTDNLLRKQFSQSDAITKLGLLDRNAIVHLIEFTPNKQKLAERRQQAHRHRLAPIGEAFGGIVMRLRGEIKDRQFAAPILRHLVVPDRIDKFVVTVGNGTGNTVKMSRDSVPLGTGHREFGRHRIKGRERTAGANRHARVSGLLWSRPIRKTSARSLSLQRDLESLIVGDANNSKARPRELRTIALRLEAVSRQTSLLWPGSQVTEHIDSRVFGRGGSGWGTT